MCGRPESARWLGQLGPQATRTRRAPPANCRVHHRDLWALAVIFIGVIEWLIDPKTFHTVWLGPWWAVETVTTVAYGDVVPGQTAGKVIASFLMLGGLSLLSVSTAAITSGFVARAEAQREASTAEQPDPVIQKLDEMATQLAEVRAELSRLHRRLPPE